MRASFAVLYHPLVNAEGIRSSDVTMDGFSPLTAVNTDKDSPAASKTKEQRVIARATKSPIVMPTVNVIPTVSAPVTPLLAVMTHANVTSIVMRLPQTPELMEEMQALTLLMQKPTGTSLAEQVQEAALSSKGILQPTELTSPLS